MILEVCVDSLKSFLIAKDGGADRIELCSALGLGGLTPSFGLMEMASKHRDIETFVMIRPRSGDFIYNDDEYTTMKSDIRKVKELGLSGIVTGILHSDGRIDIKRMSELVSISNPLPVSFHRAFDYAKDPHNQIPLLIELGVIRILTSGMRETAIEGQVYINELQKRFGNEIIIMPGSGINANNIKKLYESTKCTSFHMSGKTKVESEMSFRAYIEQRNATSNEFINHETDYDKIESVKKILDQIG